MWADLDEDGTCHIGVDVFFAKVLGRIERIGYNASSGEHFPSIGLTANGIDLQMTFPRKIAVSTTNSHLRAEPNRIVSDPYTLGWLFEGKPLTAVTNEPDQPITKSILHADDLLCGKKAKTWMENEIRRLTELVSSQSFGDATHDRSKSKGPRLLADGGTFTENIFSQVTREQSIFLFKEFFTLPSG
jgi:glycine cleavage system H lipoate-binding protein